MKRDTTNARKLPVRQQSKPRKAPYVSLALASGFGAILAACGGGGSSTSTPPPPPPPVNAAPSASLSADAAVLEGMSFIVDASGSSDADGDTLTYSYTVLSGPAIDLSRETGSSVTLEAPFVDMDTPINIQVSVSDGSATSTADVTVTITNEVLGADAGLGLEAKAEAVVSRPIKDTMIAADNGLVFFAESVDGQSTDLYSARLTDPETFSNLAESFPDDRAGSDLFSDYVTATSAIPVEAIAIGETGVQFFDYVFRDDGSTGSRRVTLDVEDACALVTSREGETSAGKVMVIGRKTGLSFYSFEERDLQNTDERQIQERSFTLLDSINEVIEQALRRDNPMFPQLAVRELIANALIHQDMTISGTGPQIELFEDRIEFTNPGTPLVPTDRMIDLPPRSRNEALAAIMRRMGICEEQGSGLDKVISSVEVYQLPPPLFKANETSMQVVLYGPRKFADMTPNERVRACYQHSILKLITDTPMTNKSLRKRFGIEKQNAAQASKVLGKALEEGLIKYSDPDHPRSGYVPHWA